MDKYLSIAEDILENGLWTKTRSGRVFHKFGYKREYDLTESFPIVTTKKMWFNGIVDELLWFISGSTNVNDLKESVQKIWEPWADEDGDLGPIYGKQLRDWNGHYDQLSKVIENIEKNPTSRRHVISLWNAPMIQHMALPPCHGNHVQFNVRDNLYKDDIFLDMSMTQRSADVALGLPWNISSYSLLLHMVAEVLNMKPGKFVHFIGNAHVYKDHVENMKKQIKRKPLDLPDLKINGKDSIDDYTHSDFELVGYQHRPAMDYKIYE